MRLRASSRCAASCCWASCCRCCWSCWSTPSACTGRRCARPTRPTTARCWPRPSRSASSSRSAAPATRRALRATVPYSALEAFEADNRSRMFYKVSGFQGEMVSGFDDLPAWRGKLPDKGAVRGAGRLLRRRLPRAAGARGGAAAAGGQRRGAAAWPRPGGRDAGAAPDAGAPDPGRHAVAAGRAAGRADRAWCCGWCSARRGRCASSARSCAAAPRTTSSPIAAADAPRELLPLVDATNQVMARLAAPAGPPEALRARHRAPAAHAAGGAEDAGAVGAARRRRAGAGAARDQPHGRPRHGAGQPDAGAGQGRAAAPAGRRAGARLGRDRPRRGARPVAR